MTNKTRITVLESIVIDHIEGRYLSFPDVVKTASGSLLCVYRDADIHYPADTPTTELILMDSFDNGRSWCNRRIFLPYPDHRPREEYAWHCARLQRMSDGRICLLCDITQPPNIVPEIFISFSEDNGVTWSPPQDTGARGIMPDRLLEFSPTEWAFAYHWRDHGIDRLSEWLYATTDAGHSWSLRSQPGADARYDLCEASIVQQKDGSLVCYLRENSFLHIPTIVTHSHDKGHSWSPAALHPTYAHRPCAGVLPDGSILVTYRNVGGNPGLVAWRGPTEAVGFAISGRALSENDVSLSASGVAFSTSNARWSGAEFIFPPIMDWEDQLDLTVRLQRLHGERYSLGIRAGGIVEIDEGEARFIRRTLITQEGKQKLLEDTLCTVRLETTEFHDYRVTMKNRNLELQIDGRLVASAPLGERPYERDRKISFGNISFSPPEKVAYEQQAGQSNCSRILYSLLKADGEHLSFSWDASELRYPNDYERQHCWQLDHETSGEWPEAGYSGWVQLDEDHIFCIDYRRGEAEKPYIVGYQLKLI